MTLEHHETVVLPLVRASVHLQYLATKALELCINREKVDSIDAHRIVSVWIDTQTELNTAIAGAQK